MKTIRRYWQTVMTTGLVIALVSCKENLQDVSQGQDQNRTEVENIARLYGLKVVNSNQLTGRVINVSSTQALRDSLKKYYIPVGTTFVRKIPVRVLPGFSTAERQRLAGLPPKQLAEELRKWRASTEGARIGTGGAGTDLVCHNCPPDGNNPPDTDPGGGDDPGSDYPVNGEPGAPPQDNPFDPTNSSGPGMMPPNDGPGDLLWHYLEIDQLTATNGSLRQL